MHRLIRDERGQGTVEYALIAGAIVLSLYVAATGMIRIQGGLYQSQFKALQEWRAP